MESPLSTAAPADPTPDPGLTLVQRTLAVFARPGAAWSGLGSRVQWWFPTLIVALVGAVVALVLHHRAILPMMTDAWEDQVAKGNMTAEQLQHLEVFFGGPSGMLISVAQQFIILPVVILLTGLLVWFGVGFVLGRTVSYRLALEVAAWSSLITIPAHVFTTVLAWGRETMKGLHVGFGLLLPDTETPSHLMTWVGIVLDALGPLSMWYLVVLILGAAAVSGAPRKMVTWVLGGLYLVLVLLFASLGAMFAPAG